MILFLTSSPCSNDLPEGLDIPCILNEANGFVELLSQCWKPDSQCLIVSSDPDNYEMNDEMAETFGAAFSFHGLTLSDLAVCDSRNEEDASFFVGSSDVIILAGGHVPTENAFFHRIHLKELLQDFPGIVIGISAGTMNCAGVVYAQPELEGESIDPDYERFLPGLGLTGINVLPHYQQVKDYYLDGKPLFESITYPDSFGRQFLALVDGSFVLECDGHAELYGEAYLIEDGQLSQICREGEHTNLY
ncbi:Type 1 glutamine amidotransferase-like domain-containing protein [Lacrimispora sp. 210928-DFI.3.58]|uniref:Type 1 glutamine amidotransferase-like domain-containing protein n=1 Tax=Lacrimispora sp. 210928-DFI.3.58 TaxID=2883214 RepID=UPI0015B64714|nr:Type 1 glutamine amidotransferase-like domain-containing protein [Lacrimispora sp. 210928-DFI.3.58]MCB7319690.1 Type 1 glutamine amidotransferase-like domain-containing protein [Lacrimispora sp. 210928-DFI.3.58]